MKQGDFTLAYVKPDARARGEEHRRVRLVEIAGTMRTAEKFKGNVRETIGGVLMPLSTKVSDDHLAPRTLSHHIIMRACRTSTSCGASASPITKARSSFRARLCANNASRDADPTARPPRDRRIRAACGIATRSRSARCGHQSSPATTALST